MIKMSKRYLCLGALALCLLFSLSVVVGRADLAGRSLEPQRPGQCADDPNECKAPAKYLGENNRCACFSCEYGSKNQRILCTSREADKKQFMLIVSRSK